MEIQKRLPLPPDASPQEKYDRLILTFYGEWQEYFGNEISYDHITTPQDAIEHGFSNTQELREFFCALIENGLLGSKYPIQAFREIKPGLTIRMTYSGLNYCLSLLESGKNSTRCFVAMKYSDDMVSFYDEGIAKAIEDNGFRPVRVDREHTENEQTINDFIIASIKQSRFCVADLTHQSLGAYFEAGYALGRGLPVIYTCHRDDFEKVHFDLKAMQVIQYSTPEELHEALSLKIQAKILE
ncbi:MAG TPA: hypothetical protein PK228_09420 [Saprospiraceae bacterium]|nr:hypothetical protein [Saprospiraceae bacterium]